MELIEARDRQVLAWHQLLRTTNAVLVGDESDARPGEAKIHAWDIAFDGLSPQMLLLADISGWAEAEPTAQRAIHGYLNNNHRTMDTLSRTHPVATLGIALKLKSTKYFEKAAQRISNVTGAEINFIGSRRPKLVELHVMDWLALEKSDFTTFLNRSERDLLAAINSLGIILSTSIGVVPEFQAWLSARIADGLGGQKHQYVALYQGTARWHFWNVVLWQHDRLEDFCSYITYDENELDRIAARVTEVFRQAQVSIEGELEGCLKLQSPKNTSSLETIFGSPKSKTICSTCGTPLKSQTALLEHNRSKHFKKKAGFRSTSSRVASEGVKIVKLPPSAYTYEPRKLSKRDRLFGPMRFAADGEDLIVMYDTGCAWTMINRAILQRYAPHVRIRKLSTPVTWEGFHSVSWTDEYAVLTMFVPATCRGKIILVELTQQVYVDDTMTTDMLIGMDIMGPQFLTINMQKNEVTLLHTKGARFQVFDTARQARQAG